MFRKTIATLCLFIGLSSFGFLYTYADGDMINFSPIVQVKSYKTTFDTNTQLLWWGSASIINDKGVIITNNHVVDDGKGNPLTIFNICVSQHEEDRVNCPYTATLINRNETMDIAILKIDPTDIYGQKVDYTKFNTIDVDFEYVPKTTDEVEAVWYPWVGSDTITKTKGIVSGTAKNNDITYIKTDTLIAWGNSGWALEKDGKLVWIPTFTKGGFTDSNLGYALLISEAKKFITSNIDSTTKPSWSHQFADYKKQLDKINDLKSVSDKLLSVNFWTDYELINYIPDKKVTFNPKSSKESIPQTIGVYLRDMPMVQSENDFLYYVESIGLYSKSFQKLKKTTISGIDFFEPVSIYDSSNGGVNVNRNLFGRVWNSLITIYGDLWSVGENNIKSVSKKFDDFITTIKFKKDTISTIVQNFDLKNPQVKFLQNEKFIYDASNGFFKIFIWGNIHEFIEVQLNLFDIFAWKNQSIEKIFEQETADINQDNKTLVSFKGHPGFLFCSDTNAFLNLTMDEKGNPLNQNYCRLKLFGFISGTEEYFLEFYLVTDKKNIKDGLTSLLATLPKLLIVPEVWDTTTLLPNVFKNQIKLQFTDLLWQSEGFKQKLKLLVKYKLLENTTSLEANTPMKWGEFLDMYFRVVYAVKFDETCKVDDYACKFKKYSMVIGKSQVSLDTIFTNMNVHYKFYVNKSKIAYLPDYFDLIFSWVPQSSINEEFLVSYAWLKWEDQFAQYKKNVDDLNYSIYGSKKILFSSIYPNGANPKFMENKTAYFVKGTWIFEKMYYANGKIDFTHIKKNLTPEKNAYEILLKGQAIDMTVDNMDLGLFDAILAKKKDTSIDGQG